ncbi:LOW QUALITY PROTEIN: ferritin heavy polypeptide-like 17 [Erethizon dorsatum]
MAAAPLQLRQNYHLDCEAAVNVQIQLQLYASYIIYLSMAVFCNRFDVALKNFSSFFLRRSHQWRDLAEKLMWMQTDRGGCVIFCDITRPEKNDWHGGLQAMESAFHLEKTINQSLLELHWLATYKSDPNLCDFLQCHYLRAQVQVLKEMAEHLASHGKMGTMGRDVADYVFDKVTLGKGDKND